MASIPSPLCTTSCNVCVKHPRLVSFMALTMFEPLLHTIITCTWPLEMDQDSSIFFLSYRGCELQWGSLDAFDTTLTRWNVSAVIQ